MGEGIFTVSLDFEQHWGTHDTQSLAAYREDLLGACRIIPAVLELFAEYEVHVTWATVGLLLFETKDELMQGMPDKIPAYVRTELSPYPLLRDLGSSEKEDPFHYAASLVRLIRSYPYQEIGSHTFSHYYCLEEGQTHETFAADLKAVQQAMYDKYGETVRSFVFPKNQIQQEYLSSCLSQGILAYRGTPRHWIYDPGTDEQNSSLARLLRLLDTYVCLTGHHTYQLSEIADSKPFNIRASRFLRAYSRLARVLEPLKINRIKSGLTYAAKHNSVYHLWWHPHNFGKNAEKNINLLREILQHYAALKTEYGFKSLNMGEIADQLVNKEQSNNAKDHTAGR